MLWEQAHLEVDVDLRAAAKLLSSGILGNGKVAARIRLPDVSAGQQDTSHNHAFISIQHLCVISLLQHCKALDPSTARLPGDPSRNCCITL